jgi:hypothetical protein
MREELYFCLELTENEHFIIKDELFRWCLKNDLKLVYYRKLKEGHVPMFREVKIRGKNIGQAKKFIKEKGLVIEKNPHKSNDYWLKRLGLK